MKYATLKRHRKHSSLKNVVGVIAEVCGGKEGGDRFEEASL